MVFLSILSLYLAPVAGILLGLARAEPCFLVADNTLIGPIDGAFEFSAATPKPGVMAKVMATINRDCFIWLPFLLLGLHERPMAGGQEILLTAR